MKLNLFGLKLNSASTQARLDTATQEIMRDRGDFSGSLKELTSIASTNRDRNENQTGHGVEALNAIEKRLHKPSVNPEQVKLEVIGRLEQIGSVEAKELIKKLYQGKIIVTKSPAPSTERNLGETLARETL